MQYHYCCAALFFLSRERTGTLTVEELAAAWAAVVGTTRYVATYSSCPCWKMGTPCVSHMPVECSILQQLYSKPVLALVVLMLRQ